MIDIVTTTINRHGLRGGPEYFFNSWDNWVKNGALTSKHIDKLSIFIAKPDKLFIERVKRHTHRLPTVAKQHLGVFWSTYHALKHMLEAGKSPYILLLQDDVHVAKNFFPELSRWLNSINKKGDVFTLYTPYSEVGQISSEMWKYPNKKFYSFAAVCFKRDFLQRYIKWIGDNFTYQNTLRGILAKGADNLLRNYAKQNNTRIIAHCPNIALHVGSRSSIGNSSQFKKEYRKADLKKSCLKTRPKKKPVKKEEVITEYIPPPNPMMGPGRGKIVRRTKRGRILKTIK